MKATFESVLDKLNSYQALVIEYKVAKDLYDSIQPIVVRPLTKEPKGRSELTETERVVQKRMPIGSNMDESLKMIQERIYDIENMIQLADDPMMRLTLSMRYQYGYTIEKTSELMDCSISTIKRQTNQGIRNIVKNLNRNEPK